MNRKLFILAGCLFLLGIVARGQAPVANFTANVTSGCAPLGVKFSDQSANNPTSWEWDFGNGQTSSLQNPSISYGTAGNYTVTLIAKNASGADAIRQTNYITVYTSPTVSFGPSGVVACVPSTIQFENFSQPGTGLTITAYAWTFGDGATSTDVTPSHVYTQPGYYNVGLKVTNSGGCSNSATYTRALRLVDGVQPNFTWNQSSTSCTAPYLVNFVNQTAGPGTLTYTWSLGSSASPATSTATNPTGISYPAAGSYTVMLTAQSSLGCSDTITQTVPLSSNTPVITAPAAGCLNTPVNFSNGTTPAPLSSSWTFGDGATSNQASTTHTYTAPGTYTVTLTNTYASCTGTTTSSITIGANLVPAFTAAPVSACQAPLAVQFTDQTSPVPTQWLWNFGDGNTATQQNPNHTYTTTGNFTVMLTATSAAGCSGTTTKTQEVNITAPTITMVGVSGCVGAGIGPAYTVTAPDGIASYSWSAPGATPSSSTSANPLFVYPAEGFYSLTLTVTTNGGCTTTQTFTNSVDIGTPTTPAFTANPAVICGNDSVTFTSTGNPADQWSWNFGDGTPLDTGATVKHAFKQFGTVPVTLTIDNHGCLTKTVGQTETVNPTIPNFGDTINCTTNNESVTFIDSSKVNVGDMVSYTWNFGDGATQTVTGNFPVPAPTHTYPSYNDFIVKLIIVDGACSDTIRKNILVENIIPSFTINPNPACTNSPILLQETSQSFPHGTGTGGYLWNVNGVNHRGGDTYTTSFPATGTYPIVLTQNDLNGCLYSSPASNVTVTGPTAKFTPPAGGCINSPLTFTDMSTPYSPAAPLASWTFNYGDGSSPSTFTAAPYTHQYADTGSFTVIETVTDQSGCSASDTITNAVQITSPTALFFVPDSFYCPAEPLTFIDSSRGYGLTENWQFGDGNTSTTPTNTYPPTSGVAYPVTLTVTDKFGCQAQITKNVNIQSPIAAFSISDTTAICAPLQTMFTAAGQYYDSLYWEFGDGTTSTLANTSHFYNSYDTFTATLVVQGPGGCQDSAKRRVLVLNPNTTTTFNFTPKTACDSVVADFTIVPPGYTTFTLNFGDGPEDSSQNRAPVHTYRGPNIFSPLLYLTDATGCIVSIYDTALTVLGAVPFFTVSPSAFCDTGTVGFTDYTISNNGVLSETYSFGDGTSGTSATTPFNASHFYNTPGFLLATLNVVTNANCTASYTDTIKVWQTPHPIISDSGNLCAGLIQFLGSLVTPDVDSVTWLWNFGNGQTANVQNPLVNAAGGTYAVSLKTSVAFGCSDTTSTSVTIHPEPTIKGPKEISTPVGVPVTIPFQYSNDINTYTWTPAANLSCADCANPVATLTFAQTYTIMVTDSNNCADTASILINTICNEENYFLPNTFSPNGDGVNDYFYPRGTSLYNIQSMSVFNRWGQMVFQRKNFPSNSETMGWDGTFNGKPAPSDAYVYIVEVICNNAQVIALHGNVTLVR